MKKTIILNIITLILVILIGMLCIANKNLTKDEFILLMKSFEQVTNVKIEGSMTKYIKDEYILSIREDGLYTWSNSKTKECIGYFPTLGIYSFLAYNDAEVTDLENSQYKFIRI